MSVPSVAVGSIPKGKAVLLSGGYDHTIRFWEVHSGLSFKTMQYPDSVKKNVCYTSSNDFYSVFSSLYQKILFLAF